MQGSPLPQEKSLALGVNTSDMVRQHGCAQKLPIFVSQGQDDNLKTFWACAHKHQFISLVLLWQKSVVALIGTTHTDLFSVAVVVNGVATGIDIGLSNLSYQTITLSFYVMCKSTTPLYLLLFTILWRIERYGYPSTMIGVWYEI